VRQLALDFLNTSFNEALTLLGGIIFGIFGKVAMGSRFRNGANHPRTIDCLQAMQFFAQLFSAFYG